MKKRICIIGAGPAGLSGAYEIFKHSNKFEVIIFESDAKYVGGISRTVQFKKNRYDIGGHRFFSKNQEINQLWKEWLGDDLLKRNRKSSIFYQKKFYDYPLKFWNALKNLGPLNAIRAILSYLRYKIKPIKKEKNYEEWMINRFGKYLFNTFFKTYTEKIWGIPVGKISKNWAIQRIKTFSLGGALLSIFSVRKRKSFKTLIDKFYYPQLGPGMMWERVAELVIEKGGVIHMGEKVTTLVNIKGKWIVNGEEFDYVISTMSLKDLFESLNVSDFDFSHLKYRDFITVFLLIDVEKLFDDNWVYIHDPEVKVGRIQNFKNWSSLMIDDQSKTSLGMEYFIFENDDLWRKDDSYFLDLAKQEVVKLGLCTSDQIVDGDVHRMKKAYPVYDDNYDNTIQKIKEYLQKLPNLFSVGRNGTHRWNNQDHSMVGGLIAARKIIDPNYPLDEWDINTDVEYHESSRRIVPQKIS